MEATGTEATEAGLPAATIALLQSPQPDILDLATALINIDSTSGREQLMSEAMAIWFKAHGYTLELQPVAAGDHGTEVRHNVLAYAGDRSKIRLLFNTHLDVVPPWFPARLTEETDGTYLRGTRSLRLHPLLKLPSWCLLVVVFASCTLLLTCPSNNPTNTNLGRGSCDTKSLSASMLLAGLDPRLQVYRFACSCSCSCVRLLALAALLLAVSLSCSCPVLVLAMMFLSPYQGRDRLPLRRS